MIKSDHTHLWESISQTLESKVSADAFNRWFKNLAIVDGETGAGMPAVVVEAPSEIHKLWIETNYLEVLREVVSTHLGADCEVKISVNTENEADLQPVVNDKAGESKLLPFAGASAPQRGALMNGQSEGRVNKQGNDCGLNAQYQFSNFVVGPNNQFAHAASLAVAEAPSVRYNPLFVHGGSGLGKTHLMQAIGNHISSCYEHAKVVYLTCETFINEFIDAIQRAQLGKFRARYRKAEVLLLDDVQFLAGKDRSQEEFFHTFNSLFDGQKHIVITSDRPACEISKLEPRLVSRFECGLTVELSPPSMETRLAILQQKRDQWKVKVDEAVMQFIAERITRNVRRLEGALMRVASVSSLSGQKVGINEVETLLKDILREEAAKQVTIDSIQRKVAEYYDIRLADMSSRRRPANIAMPRQVAMYLSRKLTNCSLVEIGEAFGGRDHGTVIHAHKKVSGRVLEEPEFRHVIEGIESTLR